MGGFNVEVNNPRYSNLFANGCTLTPLGVLLMANQELLPRVDVETIMDKSKADYVAWFVEFGREMFRVLAPDGSLILNIGGSYNPGLPTRSLYHFKLLVALVEEVGFHLAQECFWYNPAKMPMPAEWVTVRRIRVKDAVEYVWWLSKTPWPKANNRRN